MKNFLHKWIFILILLLISSCSADKKPAELLVDVDEKSIQEVIKRSNENKAVMINVWATWCAPCIEEFPYLMKLHEEYGDDFNLLLINADFEEARAEAVTFLINQGVDFETYYKTGRDNDFIPVVSEEWTGALPFTLVLDREGNRIAQWEGKAEYEQFEQQLLKALEN